MGIGIEDEGRRGDKGLCWSCCETVEKAITRLLRLAVCPQEGRARHDNAEVLVGKVTQVALDGGLEVSGCGHCRKAFPFHILDTPISGQRSSVHDSLRSYVLHIEQLWTGSQCMLPNIHHLSSSSFRHVPKAMLIFLFPPPLIQPPPGGYHNERHK